MTFIRPQVLSAIELARQARIAANRAYLASLKMGPRAIASGSVKPVGAADELVLSAARLLAEKAAVEEARTQASGIGLLIVSYTLHVAALELGGSTSSLASAHALQLTG